MLLFNISSKKKIAFSLFNFFEQKKEPHIQFEELSRAFPTITLFAWSLK